MRVVGLGFDVDGLVTVQRVHDRRQHQALRVGAGETAVAVRRPLHGRAHAVAVAQVDIVAHAQFVAVVQGGRAGHRQQQAGEQFDTPAVTLQQRRQAAADAQVDAGAAVFGVVVPQVVALAVGDHFQGQLIVVAQEDRPLAVGRDFRGLAQDVGDREAVFHGQGHVHARHQREVEGHVAFVALAFAEVRAGVLGPLVGLGQQHAVGVVGVDFGADRLEYVVGFGEVLVVGAIALDQVGDGVQAQAIDTQVEPEAHHPDHRLEHLRVVEVEVGLVRVEAVPEVLAGDRVPGPVGLLGVEEDDARAVVLLVVIRPHVEVPCLAAALGMAGALEPGMLVAGVVDDQLGDYPQAAFVRLGDEAAGIGQVAVVGVHGLVFGDVVAVVAAWRGIERQQPQGVDAQLGDVVELADQAGEIADAVVVRVEERLDVQLVDDGVLVPQRVVDEGCRAGTLGHVRLLSLLGNRVAWFWGCCAAHRRQASSHRFHAGITGSTRPVIGMQNSQQTPAPVGAGLPAMGRKAAP
ncbi:hypothetical protein D3C79_537200 [compost metagenome]